MKTKYLFLMRTVNIGGAERFQLDYFRFIDYNKYLVIFGAMNDIFSEYLKKDNLPVEIIKLPDTGNANGLKKFLLFLAFFRKINPNCIVFNDFWLKSFSLSEVIAAFLVTKGNVRMIVHCNPTLQPKYKSKFHLGFIPGIGFSWRKERFLKTFLGLFIKVTLTVSRAAKESLLEHKFSEKKIKIAYPGVDVDKFCQSNQNRNNFRKKINLLDSDLIIVSTARFDALKRIDRLIEAFSILAPQKKDIYLILAGNGPHLDKLMTQVGKLDGNIKKRIYFLGYLDNISELLQACDIYVLPSDSEGLPLATLEALSCGLITVVTNTGGLAEIIEDGSNGFLIEKSLKGVLEGLNSALSLSQEERNKISSNAKRSVESNFILKENVERGLRILGLNNEQL